jgi:hypothetical protein
MTKCAAKQQQRIGARLVVTSNTLAAKLRFRQSRTSAHPGMFPPSGWVASYRDAANDAPTTAPLI